jgi:hypothetical protein
MTCTMNVLCMHCKAQLSEEFVVENVERTPEYLEHRGALLFSKEQARMPQTQAATKTYLEAKAAMKPLHKLMCINLEHMRQTFEKYQKRRDMDNRKAELKPIETLEFTLSHEFQRLKRIVESFGLTADATEDKPAVFVKACIAASCHGFLSEDFKCALCSLEVCKDCHEPITAGHNCDKETVASVKALLSESKPCPSCSAAISKVDGCDQMWCTQCHTTFSWRTGMKETGKTHNPHYYEWMRRSGIPIPRAVPGCAPARFPTYQGIYNRFSAETKKQWELLHKGLTLYKNFHAKYPKHASLLAGHIKPPELKTVLDPLPSLPYYFKALTAIWSLLSDKRYKANHFRPADMEEEFRKLRVKYMANELNADQFKVVLLNKEFEELSNRNLYSIHTMTFAAAADVFAEWRLGDQTLAGCHDTYSQLQRLLTYTNECLTKHDAVFGQTQPKYEQNIFNM